MSTHSAKATLIGLLITGLPVTATAQDISPLQKMTTWLDRGSVPVIVLEFVKEELNLDLSSEADRQTLLVFMAAHENRVAVSNLKRTNSALSAQAADALLLKSLLARMGNDEQLLVYLDNMVMGIAV